MSAVLNIVPAGVIVVHSAYSQGERVLQIRDDRKVGVVGHLHMGVGPTQNYYL